MTIRVLTVADLEAALSDEKLWASAKLPITRHRALAHVRNPRARPSDAALFVAYDGDEVVAYEGMLPDHVYLNGEEHRIGWMSTWWVDPSRRGGGAGTMLLSKAFSLYDEKVATSDPSPSAERIYRRFDKLRLHRTPGTTFVLRCCTSYFGRKRLPRLWLLAPVLAVLDALANVLVRAYHELWSAGSGRRTPRVEYLTELDDEAAGFIERHRKRELTRRGRAELDWIYRYPWVLSTPFADETSERYAFSSSARRFAYWNVKVRGSDGRMTGFLMLKIRDNQLSVPYAYYHDDGLDDVVHTIARHALGLRAELLTVFHPDILARLTRTRLPYLARFARSRLYVISKCFDERALDGVFLQDGDGDCAFF